MTATATSDTRQCFGKRNYATKTDAKEAARNATKAKGGRPFRVIAATATTFT